MTTLAAGTAIGPASVRSKAGRRQALLIWAALAAIVVVTLVINARWVLAYRSGQLLDIDEAGYLRIALGHYYALVERGFFDWLGAGWAPFAPLAPMLASFAFLVGGPEPTYGFAVPLLSTAGTVLVAYALGAALRSRWAGLLAALLVATAPVMVDYARSFHFAAPATLATALAFLALVKSDRFDRLWVSVAFGVFAGLMPLARTMCLAYLPGLFLAALLVVLATEDRRSRRMRHLVIAGVVATVIVLGWVILTEWEPINYLLYYGYGDRAAEYGDAASLLTADSWLTTAKGLAYQMLTPHFLVAVAGLAALGLAALVIAVWQGPRAAFRRALGSGELPLLVFFAAGETALASTGNEGSAFEAPLVPVLLVLAVVALLRWRSQVVAALVGVAVVAVSVTAFLPKVKFDPAAEPTFWQLPVLDWTLFTDGRGTIQRYEIQQAGAAIMAAEVRPWWDAIDAIGLLIAEHEGPAPQKAIFAMRHHLVNVNSVGLQMIQWRRYETWLMQIEPRDLEPTVAGYTAWLTSGDQTLSCVLITMDRNDGEFTPAPDPEAMAVAAVAAGFGPVGVVTLPAGQVVTVWRRVSAACPPEGGAG